VTILGHRNSSRSPHGGIYPASQQSTQPRAFITNHSQSHHGTFSSRLWISF
jgi:hypothetical protein